MIPFAVKESKTVIVMVGVCKHKATRSNTVSALCSGTGVAIIGFRPPVEYHGESQADHLLEDTCFIVLKVAGERRANVPIVVVMDHSRSQRNYWWKFPPKSNKGTCPVSTATGLMIQTHNHT
jgi:hypothetical protein